MATRPPERLWFDDFYVVAVDLGVNVSDLFLDVVERRRLVIGDNCETGQKERIPRRYFVDRPRSMVVPPYHIDHRKAVLFVGERPRWKNIKVQGAILQSIPEWEDNPHDPRDNFASDSIAKTSFVVPMRYIDEEPWVMVDEIFVERVDRGDVYYVPKDPEWLPPINPKNEPEAVQNQEPTMQEDPPADSSTDESSSRPPNSPAALELSGLVATLWRDMVKVLALDAEKKNVEVPATPVEHHKAQHAEFKVFASQGDGRRIIQMSPLRSEAQSTATGGSQRAPKKKIPLEAYEKYQRDTKKNTGNWASGKNEEAWGMDNGYSVDSIRAARVKFKTKLNKVELSEFTKSGPKN
jgi:hypothetical protein